MIGRRRGSIGSQRALGGTRRSTEELETVLVGIVDRVTLRMRRARRVGRTVVLRLRFGDFSRATRSHTLPCATAHTGLVLATARGLLSAELPVIARRGLTLLGLSVANLESASAVQLALPLGSRWSDALDAALDEVRDRFGVSAVTRAVLLGPDQGWAIPQLPD